MHRLHAATGPHSVSDLELLFCTCFASTPAPFAIIGKLAPIGEMPWQPLPGHSVPATTRLERECIQWHIAGASLNSASQDFGFWWGMTDLICIDGTGLIEQRGVTAQCERTTPGDYVTATMLSPLGDRMGGLN